MKLKISLKQAGYTQVQAAKEIGVSERTMRYYLSETNPIEMKPPVKEAFDRLIKKGERAQAYSKSNQVP